MNTQELVKSKKFKITVFILGSVLIILVSFSAGIAVGIHKARFSFNFGRNYERNFIGSRMERPELGGFMREFGGRDFRNAHGLAGTIISIVDNNIVVKDQDNKENTVAVSDKTVIKSGRDDIKISDLKNDEQIVVMGKPGDNGLVNADLIRVFNNNNGN